MRALLERHPETTIIWAHVGLGRVVRPVLGGTTDAAERAPDHVEIVESLLGDPRLANLHFDISWDEVAKYFTASPESVARAATVIERHPDRFLFGTDNVASPSAQKHFAIYEQYAPLWRALSPATSELVRKGNYERLFDAARRRVREWERKNIANGG
jgi:predicted TIM-barrel fold metal-dependent hydrolase